MVWVRLIYMHCACIPFGFSGPRPRCGGATVCVRGYSEPTMGSDLVCGSPVSPRRLVVQWFTPPDRLEGTGRGGAGAPAAAAEGVCAGV